MSVRHDWGGELPLPSKEIFISISLTFLIRQSSSIMLNLESGIFRLWQQAVLSFNVVQIHDSILVANHVDVGILYI